MLFFIILFEVKVIIIVKVFLYLILINVLVVLIIFVGIIFLFNRVLIRVDLLKLKGVIIVILKLGLINCW